MPENRIDPLAPPSSGPGSPGYVAPAISPTGKAMVPASWVPWLTIASVAFGAVAAAPTLGLSFIPAGVVAGAALASTISLILLGTSPGLRK